MPARLPHAQVVRELSRAGEALADLVAYGASRPEVRFVTYSDLIRWMQVGLAAWPVGLRGPAAAWRCRCMRGRRKEPLHGP